MSILIQSSGAVTGRTVTNSRHSLAQQRQFSVGILNDDRCQSQVQPRQGVLEIKCAKRRSNKKKNAKKKQSVGTDEEPSESARRIVGNVGGYSVSRQVRIIRRIKANEKARAAPPKEKQRQARNFKKKGREDVEAIDLLGNQKRKAYSFYGPDGKLLPPLLMIDGYNVCGEWEELKPDFVKGNLEQARAKLFTKLAEHHAATGKEIVLVWDAIGVHGYTTREKKTLGVEVVFADESADAFIEEYCHLNLEQNYPRPIHVVSSDNEVQNVCSGKGAITMNVTSFIGDMNYQERMAEMECYDRNIEEGIGFSRGGDITSSSKFSDEDDQWDWSNPI